MQGRWHCKCSYGCVWFSGDFLLTLSSRCQIDENMQFWQKHLFFGYHFSIAFLSLKMSFLSLSWGYEKFCLKIGGEFIADKKVYYNTFVNKLEWCNLEFTMGLDYLLSFFCWIHLTLPFASNLCWERENIWLTLKW